MYSNYCFIFQKLTIYVNIITHLITVATLSLSVSHLYKQSNINKLTISGGLVLLFSISSYIPSYILL